MTKTAVQPEPETRHAAPGHAGEEQKLAPQAMHAPMMVARSAAADPPPSNGAAPQVRAAAAVSGNGERPGTVMRARLMHTLQRTIGNSRAGRTLTLQREAASPQPR